MSKLIQYCTQASLYNGPFGDGSPWPAAGMGYVFVSGEIRNPNSLSAHPHLRGG